LFKALFIFTVYLTHHH